MLPNIRKKMNLLNKKESETVLICTFLLKEHSIRKRENELESLRLHNMKEKKQKFGPLSQTCTQWMLCDLTLEELTEKHLKSKVKRRLLDCLVYSHF